MNRKTMTKQKFWGTCSPTAIWAFVAVVVMAWVFTASVPAMAADKPIVLRMYGGYDHFGDGTVGPAEILDGYLRQYEALNPHIKVENLGRELNPDKLVTMFIAGELPDIIETDVKFLADFYRIGMIASAPAWLKQRLQEAMFPSSVEFISMEGTVFGIPGENMVTGLWYNKEQLGLAGIAEPPRTSSELEQMGRRLTRLSPDGTITAPALVESGGWALNHTALAMYGAKGGEPYDENGALVLPDAALQRTMEQLLDWLAPDSFFAYDGFNWEFYIGQIAMGFGYPWWLSGMKTSYSGNVVEDFGVTLMPMADSYGAFKYGHGFGVNSQSKHADEAWKLMEWLSLHIVDDVTPIGHMMSQIGSLPNVPEDILSVHYADDRAIYEGFIANLDYARNTPAWERVEIAGPALRVASGEINIQTALDTVVSEAYADMARHLEWVDEMQQR